MGPASVDRWFGKSIKRLEDIELIRGEGRFIADLPVPDALHVRFVRSPLAHASVVSISTADAMDVDGIVGVYDWRDFPTAPLPPFLWDAPPEALIKSLDPRMRSSSPPLLGQGRAAYVGQAVAVVLASDPVKAQDASELVHIEYEELPIVLNTESALGSESPLVHPDWQDNVAVQFDVTVGDPRSVFAEAPYVASAHLSIARQAGIPIESRGAVATFTPQSGLTLYSSTQNVHPLKIAVSRVTGLPPEQVRVVAPDVGGGFGIKGVLYPEDLIVALLAVARQTTVRWIEDRVEHFQSAIQARGQIHDIELALSSTGQILGLRDRFLVDCGAYNPLGVVIPYNTLSHLTSVYEIPNIAVTATGVLTNRVPTAPYRGAGRPEAVFAIERVLDLAARDLGISALDIRRRNLIRSHNMPKSTGLQYRDGEPLILDGGDYERAFERAVELITADESEAAEGAPQRATGTGYACYTEGTGIGPFEGAAIRLADSGRFVAHTGASSQGQGHRTTLAQICADHLGVPVRAVDVVGGDTQGIARGWGTVASRVAVVAGNAMASASSALRGRCLELAAAYLKIPEEYLDLFEGGVRSTSSGEVVLDFAALSGLASERGEILEETSYFEPKTVTWSYGVHAVTVSVDVETGEVAVIKYVVVHDCGNVINPMIVEGQIHGGVAQGIGEALLEEVIYDERGQPLNPTLAGYPIPTANDIPMIVIDHLQTPSLLNPLGIRGIGEGGAVPPPAAIANAIDAALVSIGSSGTVDRLPIKPSYVRSLVQEGTRP